MARVSRLHSISLSLLDSRNAPRLLVASAASLSSFDLYRAPDLTATCSSAPSLYGYASPSSSFPPLSFSSARFCKSSSLIDFVGVSWSPCSLGVARTFSSGSRAGKAPDTSSASPPPADPQQEDLQVLHKELADSANNTFISLQETASSTMAWIRDSTEKLVFIFRERFDLPVYTSDTGTQLLYTSFAAALAWFVMPRVFRMLHRYSEDGSHLILKRSDTKPYEASFWSALEDPAKLFISAVAFAQLGSLIAPTTIASQYLYQIWKGAAVVSLVWFLHRWKTSVISRVLANEKLGSAERERYHALEKISTMGLFILGGMGVAETCGIAAHSILTLGGVGGVATAFAARDLLGNMLSGFALQFMKPFSIGDTIKAGPIEGQVVDIGLTSTQMLDLDKFPVAVPNSFFSSQVIVNKSRATWRSFSVKIPVQLNDFEKIPHITEEVRNMLKSHPKVTLQSGVPLCYASHVSGPSLEIALLCNLMFKGREDLLSAEQDITLQTLRIISRAGATLTPAA